MEQQGLVEVGGDSRAVYADVVRLAVEWIAGAIGCSNSIGLSAAVECRVDVGGRDEVPAWVVLLVGIPVQYKRVRRVKDHFRGEVVICPYSISDVEEVPLSV